MLNPTGHICHTQDIRDCYNNFYVEYELSDTTHVVTMIIFCIIHSLITKVQNAIIKCIRPLILINSFAID